MLNARFFWLDPSSDDSSSDDEVIAAKVRKVLRKEQIKLNVVKDETVNEISCT